MDVSDANLLLSIISLFVCGLQIPLADLLSFLKECLNESVVMSREVERMAASGRFELSICILVFSASKTVECKRAASWSRLEWGKMIWSLSTFPAGV